MGPASKWYWVPSPEIATGADGSTVRVMSSLATGTLRVMAPCSRAPSRMVTPSRESAAAWGAAWMRKGNTLHWLSCTGRTLPTWKEPSYTVPLFQPSGTNSTTVGLSHRSEPWRAGLKENRPSVCLSMGTGVASSTRMAVPSLTTPPV